MAISLRIDIDRAQLRALEARLKIERLTPAVQAGLRSAAPDVIAEVRRQIAPARDTGQTAGSVTSDARGSNLNNVGMRVFSPLISAGVLESGRRPGSRPPPVSVIQAWAARKLGTSDPGIAFVIARAIGREGSPKRRRGGSVQPYHQFEEAARLMVTTVRNRLLDKIKAAL
jgi:hypothetical protein